MILKPLPLAEVFLLQVFALISVVAKNYNKDSVIKAII